MNAPLPLPPPDLPRPELPPRQERLLHRIEKAGVRASKKVGHVVTEEELLRLKVQVMPPWGRLMALILAAGAGWGAAILFQHDEVGWAIFFGFLTLILILAAIYGVRRTFGAILEGMDANAAAELVDLTLRGIVALLNAVNR